MGYESRLFIVDKRSSVVDDKKYWGDVIAMVDLRRCPSVSDFLRNKPETDCYIFESDGNTIIKEDRYGNPLTEASIEEVIKLLEEKELSQEGRPYRRIEPLYALLKSFRENKDQWENLRVLHFGH